MSEMPLEVEGLAYSYEAPPLCKDRPAGRPGRIVRSARPFGFRQEHLAARHRRLRDPCGGKDLHQRSPRASCRARAGADRAARLLLLDEPFANLDGPLRYEVGGHLLEVLAVADLALERGQGGFGFIP